MTVGFLNARYVLLMISWRLLTFSSKGEGRGGVLLRHSIFQIFMVKFLINSQIYYHHKIEISNSKNMEICHWTKLFVLDPNLWSDISYQEIIKTFQNEAVN